MKGWVPRRASFRGHTGQATQIPKVILKICLGSGCCLSFILLELRPDEAQEQSPGLLPSSVLTRSPQLEHEEIKLSF